MVNINTFVEYVYFIQNKPIINGAVSVGAQLNNILQQAQMLPFNQDRAVFIETGQTSDYLETFLKTKIGIVDSVGDIPFPNDYEHTCAIGHYYDTIYCPAYPISMKEYFDINRSQFLQPTMEFPKYAEHAGVFKFLPRTMGSVNIQYFKTPKQPVWGFLMGSGRPVYDATTSVNFEWNASYINRVAGAFLSLIGMNLRAEDLQAFADKFAAQNTTPV